jgi:hypothetical protein
VSRPRFNRAAALPLATALTVAGCGEVVTEPIQSPIDASTSMTDATSVTDATSTMDATSTTDGAASEALPESAADSCDGVPISIGAPMCAGDLARVFRFAACSCTTFAVSGQLQTDAFDSRTDGGVSPSAAASVAANGALSVYSHTTVGGSAWAAAMPAAAGAAVTLNGDGTIARDVRSGGDFDVGGIYQVGGDVWANGNVAAVDGGSLAVVGAIHVPADASASGVVAGGGVATGAVAVALPCDCAHPIDVASLVTAHASLTGAAPVIDPHALENPASQVALPCGTSYVESIQGGVVRLAIAGRTALFVGGDVTIDTALSIDLAPGAEIDVFIGGALTVRGSFGNVLAPARVRVYVAGSAVTLADTATLGANLYAAAADLVVSSGFQQWGSIFAHRLAFSGDFSIHYDSAVLATEGCTPSASACASCGDCPAATPACLAGTCAPCATDDDCCPPLRCASGACAL